MVQGARESKGTHGKPNLQEDNAVKFLQGHSDLEAMQGPSSLVVFEVMCGICMVPSFYSDAMGLKTLECLHFKKYISIKDPYSVVLVTF